MSFDLNKLWSGCVIGVTNTLSPISQIIQLGESRFKKTISPNIASHIQIVYFQNDLIKVAEMEFDGCKSNDVSEDRDGVLGKMGNHIVFIAAPIAQDDYEMQEINNKWCKKAIGKYKYFLKEFGDWIPGCKDINEPGWGKICSTLNLKRYQDLKWDYPKEMDTKCSPLDWQNFYTHTNQLIYTCYKKE